MTVESDAVLVRRVLDGDADAYAGLVARYRDRVLRARERLQELLKGAGYA